MIVIKKPLLYRCFIFSLLLILTGLLTITALAAPDINYGQSYISYTYDFRGNPVSMPAPYEAERVVYGYELGGKPFLDLSDISYNGIDRIYIADSGNNRILICDEKLNLVTELGSYQFKGEQVAFNNPTCVFITDGMLYIADSQNSRIVVLNEKSLETDRVLEQPEIAALGSYTYIPMKLAVDYAGRIYVIAKNINKGLIQLDKHGNFESFLGAPKVTPSISEIIMRKIFNRTMREKLIKNVPTEYNAVNIDGDGFLFVTSQSANITPIAKLNGQGTNVLVSKYYTPSGDGLYVDQTGKRAESMFVDVVPREDGGYFALDVNRGRIFSYDRQGLLLYIFGSPGTSRGSFYSASAMECVVEKILVADKSLGSITVFSMTEFGRAVDTAVKMSGEGKIQEEKAAWENVLRLCSNYDIAHINLAEIETNNKQYSSAMKRLSSVGEKEQYGIAYRYARNEWLKKNFYLLVLILVALAGLAVVWKKAVSKTEAVVHIRSNRFYKELKFGTYTMFHPFDGFWDLKRECRGSLKSAIVILSLFVLWFGIRARFTGYLFMNVAYKDVNVAKSIATVLIPLLLWTVSNWCFTTLMDGKGTMKDTFIAVCYALTPYVVFSPLQFFLSFVLVGEETAFYWYLESVIWAWVIILIFFGMMMTHDYSFSKSLITAVLTLIGICLILFICLLMFNLFYEVYTYFYDIYKEISFRFY